MVRRSALWGLTALLALFPLAATAQGPLSMASMDPGSSSYSVVLTIAKVAADHAGLDIRPRPFKGTTQAIAFVDSGEVNFGLESARGLNQAFTGTGSFEGNPPLENLRLVGAIYPFHVGIIVRADSSIKTMADIRGQRMVTGYRASPNISALIGALLATGGMTKDDVSGIDVPTALEGSDQFAQGNVDVSIGGIDTVATTQLADAVGGIRYIPIGTGAEAETAARAFLPNARVIMVDPAPGRTGITEPVPVLEYDYLIYTNASTPDDVIVKIIDSMIQNRDAMVEMNASFGWWKPEIMPAQIGLPYHPAAEAHYKELGLWPNP